MRTLELTDWRARPREPPSRPLSSMPTARSFPSGENENAAGLTLSSLRNRNSFTILPLRVSQTRTKSTIPSELSVALATRSPSGDRAHIPPRSRGTLRGSSFPVAASQKQSLTDFSSGVRIRAATVLPLGEKYGGPVQPESLRGFTA